MELAKTINHPYSLAYALFHTGFLRFWRREVEFSLSCAQAVLDVSERHEFQIWKAVGTCLHGAAIASLGRAEEGLAQIQQGMEIYQDLKSPPIFSAAALQPSSRGVWPGGKTRTGIGLAR